MIWQGEMSAYDFVCVFSFLLLTIFNPVSTEGENKWPTVLVCVLVRNKQHTLPYFLTSFSKLDYPKDRISLWIRTDHNNDRTVDVLNIWLENEAKNYHKVHIKIGTNDDRFIDEETPTHWSNNRFEHVISLREKAFKYARKVWADFLFMVDADVFLTYNSTLKDLISLDFVSVSPMLRSDGPYSNFWCGMTEDYYYKRTDEYGDILNRKELGCFKVPMIHSAVLINLRKYSANRLTYDPRKITNYNGPVDDIIAFAVSANRSNVSLNICNDKHYGYIMVPLDKNDTFEDDERHLMNLKVESIYDNSFLEVDIMFKDFIYRPSKDKMGFDEIYMINLIRRPDRREKMELCFDELGLDVRIVEAVDGKQLNEDRLKELGITLMPEYLDPYHNRPMTLGEIGCFMSHYTIWKDIVDSEYDEVVVLEDDIRFEPFFRIKMERVMGQIKHFGVDWDLIYIGRKRLQNETEPSVAPSLVKAGYSYWTLGYILNYRGALKLLNAKPLLNLLPVDEYLPIMFDKHPQSSWSDNFYERDLIALSVSPLLVYPTHYTGEEGYISDTEDSIQVSQNTNILKVDL